ncbi:metal dependent phosphohydrolase [Paenibacillus curdlanolyticus YK9]|uniref:Metal dependent phosphohydrolase n=1 Tax=Paenibacillus curdlanolyticus YK9 TaxID=717606 RepID=E0IB98_9BACL|nr:HD-GYP domain-containing protein [Paenibacillus curdlanolyticus]EFM10389.1 metal dependent phosphohydrolase [Paenibacillus curdlanolyticus YK9]
MRKKASSLYMLAAVMLLPLFAYALLRSFSSLDRTLSAPTGHFYVVSIVSALAMAMAVMVGIAGVRLRNVKVTFAALAYISLAEVFLLHGLSTPGFLMHASKLPTLAAQISIVLAVSWLWLSSLSSDQPVIRLLSRYNRNLLPVWTLILGIACLLLFQSHHLMDMEFLTSSGFKWSATVYTVAFAGWTMRRYWQSYQAWCSPMQIAMVYSAGLLIVSQFIMVTGEVWHLSWWIYHLTLLISVVFTLVGIRYQYAVRDTFGESLLHLFRANPREWIQTCLSPSVRALIMTTETRDPYTAGHNYRVALYALRLGERMELNTEQLRAIALGGIVHDVGKLQVPDAILNKPGRLTALERSIIEEHPTSGFNLCKRIGFMTEELAVIRSHHERWDGTGYPDRLKHDKIPLLARITAVADVYDALTSSRSYRKAMSHQEALAIIEAERGIHFDPACVDAWLLLAQEDAEFFSRISGSDREKQLVKG